jgi:hypothetical protein
VVKTWLKPDHVEFIAMYLETTVHPEQVSSVSHEHYALKQHTVVNFERPLVEGLETADFQKALCNHMTLTRFSPYLSLVILDNKRKFIVLAIY